MTRAEKVALEAYPIKGKWTGNQYGEWDGDVNITLRSAYQQGYEQAEKDLALTWEDIRTIYSLLDETARLLWFQNKKFTDKELCEETLRKFKKTKDYDTEQNTD